MNKKTISLVIAGALILGAMAGGFSGFLVFYKLSGYSFSPNSALENIEGELGKLGIKTSDSENNNLDAHDRLVVAAVQKTSPAVVSIVITKDVPVIEQYYSDPFGDLPPEIREFFGYGFQIPQYKQNGTEKKEVGSGSGFIISSDGLILTNKHVVSDTEASYTVLVNDGNKYEAEVLARDPYNDLALIKIKASGLPTLTLADSDKIEIGQTVIAIGNALGEFKNTVSSGVVSGLSRNITASDSSSGTSERIDNVIQTDAAINPGNSGGPLLNLNGEVIGINTATVIQAQSIGFAIPINRAKKAIESYQKTGEIVSPYLGVRYVLINETIKTQNKLSVDYGAWIKKSSDNESAVLKDSPAEKAGIKEGDIILEIAGQKITQENTLSYYIGNYQVGEKASLKVLRDGQEVTLEVVFEERPNNF